MPNVLLSHQAEIDLEEIWMFVATADSISADSVLDEIEQESEILAFIHLIRNLLFTKASWHYGCSSSASKHVHRFQVFLTFGRRYGSQRKQC